MSCRRPQEHFATQETSESLQHEAATTEPMMVKVFKCHYCEKKFRKLNNEIKRQIREHMNATHGNVDFIIDRVFITLDHANNL